MEGCPLCERINGGDVSGSSPASVAFPDAHPVAPGHTLVCPRRHVEDLFCLAGDEWHDVWALVRMTQQQLAATLAANGWNVGVNVGHAAGQTVEHAHVHLIPRRRGDVADPRGGVRWVLPDRAAYWSGR